jgi:hypothetical protein
MKNKTQKRKEALARMEAGHQSPGSDTRVKKYPRTEEKRQEEMARLRKSIGHYA